MLPRRIALMLGVFILILIPVWFFVVLPLVVALPVNFSQSATLSHTEDNRFTIGGQWSGQSISISDTRDTVDKSEYLKASVSSRFSVQSLVGETLFSLKQSFLVDRLTMKNLPGGSDIKGEAYFFFPRHLKNDHIRWWPNSLGEPIDLIFVETVKLDGLRVSHYRGERSDINDTAGYEFLPMVPQKYLVLSRAVLDVYVEPASGIMVDYRDEGVSYYAGQDKRPVWDIAKWSNKFSDITRKERIEEAREEHRRLFILEVIIPLLSLILSLILFNYAISKNTLRSKRAANH